MNNLKNMKCKSVTAGKKLRMTAFNDRVDSHYKLVNISWDYSQYLAMISWQSSKKVQRSMIELSLEVPKHVTPSTVQTLLTTPSLMSLFKCLRISQRWMFKSSWRLKFMAVQQRHKCEHWFFSFIAPGRPALHPVWLPLLYLNLLVRSTSFLMSQVEFLNRQHQSWYYQSEIFKTQSMRCSRRRV